MMNNAMHTGFKYWLGNETFHKEISLSKLSEHSDAVDEAFSIALSGKQPEAWRAAWLLGHYFNNEDERLTDRLDSLIQLIPSAQPDGYQRELLKLIAKCSLNEAGAGVLADVCFSIWEQNRKQSSVRSEAFKTLIRISEWYPEMKPELQLLFEQYADSLSRGIKQSLQQRLNQSITSERKPKNKNC